MEQHIIKRFWQIAFVFTALCITSCTVKLLGTYAPMQKHSMSSSILELNNDSTFSYGIFSELQKDTFKGNWKVMKDTLLLKITKPFDDDSLLKEERIISKTNPSISLGENRLKILVQDSIPFTVATVFVNNNQSPIKLNSHGEAIVNGKIEKVRIQYQNIKPRMFTVNSTVNNDFTILLYDKAFVPLNYLSPIRKWIIKRGKLLPLDKNNKPFKNELYKKQ